MYVSVIFEFSFFSFTQGPMMGQGNRMGQPGRSSSPNAGMQNSPMRMNTASPRGPFNQFGVNFPPRMPQPMQPGGGMRQPFFNLNSNNNNDNDHGGITENEMRGMAEPKEWPPDDEVNDEDEQDDQDMQMDSDDRMLMRGGGQNQPRLPGPGMANLRALTNLFGPMLASQRAPGAPAMLGMPHSQAAQNANMQQSILSLRMLAMAGGPPGPPRFAMTASGMRIPLPPAVGVRPAGMVPGSPSPRMLTPGAGNPLPVAVSVSGGSVMVSRPGGGPPIPSPGLTMSMGNTGSAAAPSPDPEGEDDDPLGGPPPQSGGQGLPMMLQGGNRPPGGPILGRGFAPMTIRPRGPGLLGLRPGGGGGGFGRFGGPRPMMGSGGFGRMERPMFGGRFGAPIRPPVAFFDQEDKDERRLPLLDFDDQPEPRDVDERNNGPDEMDERCKSSEKENNVGDKDERKDVDERPLVIRASGLPSRWSSAPSTDTEDKAQVVAEPEASVAQTAAEEKPPEQVEGIQNEAQTAAQEVVTEVPSISVAVLGEQIKLGSENCVNAEASLEVTESGVSDNQVQSGGDGGSPEPASEATGGGGDS